MFSKIYIEEELKDHPQVKSILERFSSSDNLYIDKVENYFEKVKKPYLQKRQDLNLYLGRKKGQLVKEAPNAYGLSGESHYYFIHAYNCIYECSYCYLQGYFNSPDIVLFLNHQEIMDEMKKVLDEQKSSSRVWFHAGEFSDSLALSHLTGELPQYHDFCKKNPRAFIELRTKSANIKVLSELEALPNFVISYSLSPEKEIKEFDLKTPNLKSRLNCLNELSKLGFPLGLHFDPIVFSGDVMERYEELFDLVVKNIELQKLQYISLGVVRFTEKVFRQVKKNYPESRYLEQNLVKSFDQKIRYPQILRLNLLQRMKSALVDRGVKPELIYFCME